MEVCDLSRCSGSDSNIDGDNEDHGIEDTDNRIGKDYVSSASVKGNLSPSGKFVCTHHFMAVSVLNTRGSWRKDKFKKTQEDFLLGTFFWSQC